jgi:hypothetical protein
MPIQKEEGAVFLDKKLLDQKEVLDKVYYLVW